MNLLLFIAVSSSLGNITAKMSQLSASGGDLLSTNRSDRQLLALFEELRAGQRGARIRDFYLYLS